MRETDLSKAYARKMLSISFLSSHFTALKNNYENCYSHIKSGTTPDNKMEIKSETDHLSILLGSDKITSMLK